MRLDCSHLVIASQVGQKNHNRLWLRFFLGIFFYQWLGMEFFIASMAKKKKNHSLGSSLNSWATVGVSRGQLFSSFQRSQICWSPLLSSCVSLFLEIHAPIPYTSLLHQICVLSIWYMSLSGLMSMFPSMISQASPLLCFLSYRVVHSLVCVV